MLPIDNHLHKENHEAVLTGIVVDSDICQTTSLLLVSEMLLFQIRTSLSQEKRSESVEELYMRRKTLLICLAPYFNI